MADVFISYKRLDQAAVERIAERLRGIGLDVWFDTRLATGVSFDETIDREINAARCVLVCWSPDAIASEWVRAEASIGREAGKLASVFVRPTRLPPPFNLTHTEDLSDWRGEDGHRGWANTLARIGSLVGRDEIVEKARRLGAASAPRRPRRYASGLNVALLGLGLIGVAAVLIGPILLPEVPPEDVVVAPAPATSSASPLQTAPLPQPETAKNEPSNSAQAASSEPVITASIVSAGPLGDACPKAIDLSANVAASAPIDVTVRWVGSDGWKNGEQVLTFVDGELAKQIWYANPGWVIAKPGEYHAVLQQLTGSGPRTLASRTFMVACD